MQTKHKTGTLLSATHRLPKNRGGVITPRVHGVLLFVVPRNVMHTQHTVLLDPRGVLRLLNVLRRVVFAVQAVVLHDLGVVPGKSRFIILYLTLQLTCTTEGGGEGVREAGTYDEWCTFLTTHKQIIIAIIAKHRSDARRSTAHVRNTYGVRSSFRWPWDISRKTALASANCI